MADACADVIVGGKVYIQSGSARWEASGDVTIEPTNNERDINSTGSGRIAVVERAKPYRATMDLFNFVTGDPKALFELRCNANITVVEESRGFMHLFSAAALGGTPSLNLSTGVMSGVGIGSDVYSRNDLT
jgi:hypothetical protein